MEEKIIKVLSQSDIYSLTLKIPVSVFTHSTELVNISSIIYALRCEKLRPEETRMSEKSCIDIRKKFLLTACLLESPSLTRSNATDLMGKKLRRGAKTW